MLTQDQQVITCIHVIQDNAPVVAVSTDGGDWQFLCGRDHAIEDGVVVHAHHLFDLDPSLKAVCDLPVGWVAERESPASPWKTQHLSL